MDRSGNVIPGFSGWTRTVTVERAHAVTLAPTNLTNSGLKKITVRVTRHRKTLGSIIGYRGIGWVDAIPSPTDTTGNHGPVAVATSPDLTRSVHRPWNLMRPHPVTRMGMRFRMFGILGMAPPEAEIS